MDPSYYFSQGGHFNLQQQRAQAMRNQEQHNMQQEKKLSLGSIYQYFVSHPLCRFRNMSYEVFEVTYSKWIEKKYN